MLFSGWSKAGQLYRFLSRTGCKIVGRMGDYLCMLLKLLRRGGVQYGFCVVLWDDMCGT